MPSKADQVRAMLAQCTEDERRAIFAHLRQEFGIHQIERDLNVQAEVILEAIHRASDLSLRGVRGLIAEASWKLEVLERLDGWKDVTEDGDFTYDFKVKDKRGIVTVQVKMQRQVRQAPMLAKKLWTRDGHDTYVVETQKTRTGVHEDGGNTRPYRFGEFDILAVSMHPSTRDWSRFMYTVGTWLLEKPDNATHINTLQPVSGQPDGNWTDDFATCVEWLRSGRKQKIWVPKPTQAQLFGGTS